METKALYPFVLMLVMTGMIIGVGLLMFDKFGTAAKTSGVSILNEEQAAVDNVIYLNNHPVSGIVQMKNKTDPGHLIPAAAYNLTKDSGKVVINGTQWGGAYSVYVNYTGSVNSSSTVALAQTSTAVGSISSTWLALIVIVVVLSIVLGLVVRSFNIRQ